MNIHDAVALYNRVSNFNFRDELNLSPEMIQYLHEGIADPTNLSPLISKQIEQAEDLRERVEQMQASLQKQVEFSDTLETHVQQAEAEFESYKQSRKHDKLHNAIISFFSALIGAVIGTICTIIATRCGWL